MKYMLMDMIAYEYIFLSKASNSMEAYTSTFGLLTYSLTDVSA